MQQYQSICITPITSRFIYRLIAKYYTNTKLFLPTNALFIKTQNVTFYVLINSAFVGKDSFVLIKNARKND